ncbi:reverse transcriptase [Plakobranchus ocellatus]|uniref:Reverse transcriptase n=1 Tax=Plakobranchus ocellatus TaxID=259542 RepID=A0AAV4ARH7_9GAST|nr:reverse transcriptase [Plakobranchus ocellatus]
MGCTISLILFVLAMEVILRAAKEDASPADLGSECYMPSQKGFHGRLYHPVLKVKRDLQSASSVRCTNELEQNEFQAEEVSKPVHKKGNLDEYVCFKVASQDIPSISQ